MIKRLKNTEIDKTKWDEVVTNSDDPHVYLLSWYLDIVSPGWECLLFENYRFVMPLFVKRKAGLSYLVQPPFCQKTCIVGIGVTKDAARLFYRKLYWTLPYYNLTLANYTGLDKRKYLNGRINYTLDLTPSYETLVKDFSDNVTPNIRKATKANVTIANCERDEFIQFSKLWQVGVNDFQKQIFAQLVTEAFKRNVAKLVKAVDSKGESVAAACFLIWNHQILYLSGTSSQEGRKCSAMFLLVNTIIKEYSASGFLLDFEGSMISGVANFFRDFGAKASYYYHLKKYLFFYK